MNQPQLGSFESIPLSAIRPSGTTSEGALAARLALYTAVADVRGEEDWSDENIAAALFLVGRLSIAKSGEDLDVEQLTGLSAEQCTVFEARMRENGMEPAELLALYASDPDSIHSTLDTLVLMGMLVRGRSGEGEVAYTNTPEANAYVESQLLPQEETL